MIKDSKLYIGGNKLLYCIGKKLSKIGESLVEKGAYKVVTNASARLINPFTLIINFTIDNVEKYQLLIQGDYKSHYKESKESDLVPDIPENELLLMINNRKDSWFKKE